jgi:hypothetical protein
MSFSIATTTSPLVHFALTPPPISVSQSSLLLLPRRPSPVPIFLSTRSRLLAAVAAKEPELGGGGSEGGDGGRRGGSDPREGGQEGEGEEEGEKKMAERLSMSQKLTLAYAALVGGNVCEHLDPPPPFLRSDLLEIPWIGCNSYGFLRISS